MFEFLQRKKKLYVYTPLIVYWIVLFAATTLPAQSVPSLNIGDKINHLLAYFVLSALLHLTLIYQRKSDLLFYNAPVAAFTIAVLYGVIDELHQMLVPGRFADVLDWLADVVGSVLGVIFILLLIRKFKYIPKFR